jgi:hypothetical protein
MSAAPTWSLKAPATHDDDASLMPYLFYTLLLALWITLLAVFYGVMSDTVNRAEQRHRDTVDRTLALSRCEWKIGGEARAACRAQFASPMQAELPNLSSDVEPSLNLAYR